MEFLLCDNNQPAAAAEICRRFHLGLEIQSFADPAYLRRFPRAVEEHGALLTGIAPLVLRAPFADLNPGSFDEMIRAVAHHRFDEALETAQELGALSIICPNGFVPYTSSPSGWVRRATAFWKDLLAHHPGQARFHLENLLEPGPELVIELLDGVGSPRLDASLDVGHAHCYARLPAIDWVRRLGARIGIVHLHNNDGQSDQHRPLPDGTLPIEDVLAALQEAAPHAAWALETTPQEAPRSLNWLIKHGFLAP